MDYIIPYSIMYIVLLSECVYVYISTKIKKQEALTKEAEEIYETTSFLLE